MKQENYKEKSIIFRGPEKRQRTHAEIVADIKTLVSELEGAK